MSILFFLISFIAFILLIIGLVRPSTMFNFQTRKQVALIMGGIMLLSLIIMVVFIPKEKQNPEQQIFSTPSSLLPAVFSISPSPSPTISALIPKPKTVGDMVSIGSEAFLRISGNSDSSQIILLAPTPEIWNEVAKAFLSKDYYGILDLSEKGVFGVSNGTKVLVIDKKGILDPLYRIRILNGVRPIDEDKIGRAGWVPRAFISQD